MKKILFPLFLGVGILGYLLCRFQIPLWAVTLLLAGSCAGLSVLVVLPVKHASDTVEQLCRDKGRAKADSFCYEEMQSSIRTVEEMAQEFENHVEELELEKGIRQDFFSNASHELKTPITSIKGYAELLDAGFAKDEKTIKEFCQKIMTETDHMNSLINDILMISRLESNEVVEKQEEIRMALLVSELYESLSPIAAKFEVTIHKECMPVVYWGNRRQMYELLENLLMNAIKYNRKGGEIWLSVLCLDRELCIIVKDSGVGIKEEDQKRIFERFYRVDKGRSKATGGTGLGLSIVKHIVEYNHGSIKLESSLGCGSRFVVKLPLK